MTAAAVFNNRHLTHKNQILVLISGLCFGDNHPPHPTPPHSTPLHPTPHAHPTPPHHPQPGQGRALGPDRTLGPGPGRRSYLRIVLCSRSYLPFVLCSSSIYSKNPGKSTIRRYDPGPARDPKYDPEDTIQGRPRTQSTIWRYDRAGRGLGDTIWRRPPYPNYDPGQGSLAHTHGHENLWLPPSCLPSTFYLV